MISSGLAVSTWVLGLVGSLGEFSHVKNESIELDDL